MGSATATEYKPIGPGSDWDWAARLAREVGVTRSRFYEQVRAGRIEGYRAPGQAKTCYSRGDALRVFGAPQRPARVE